MSYATFFMKGKQQDSNEVGLMRNDRQCDLIATEGSLDFCAQRKYVSLWQINYVVLYSSLMWPFFNSKFMNS